MTGSATIAHVKGNAIQDVAPIVGGSDENNEKSLTPVTRNNGSRISLYPLPQDVKHIHNDNFTSTRFSSNNNSFGVLYTCNIKAYLESTRKVSVFMPLKFQNQLITRRSDVLSTVTLYTNESIKRYSHLNFHQHYIPKAYIIMNRSTSHIFIIRFFE